MDEMQEPTKPTEGEMSTGGTPMGSDEGFVESNADEAGSDAKAAGEKMLGQLQGMIDGVATQATPMARQIGIKAAELAAAAADRAGPFAQRAADATVDASLKFAERSRHWAAELRSKTVDEGGEHNGTSGSSVAIAEPEDKPGETSGDKPLDQG
jgi:hypothetical protein